MEQQDSSMLVANKNKTPVIPRAHSFLRTVEFRSAEFGFLPRYLAAEFFPRYSCFRGISMEFDVFHSNNSFFTDNDL